MNNRYDKSLMNMRPDYYKTESGLQPIDIIEMLNLDFNLGNVIKYLPRAGKKTEDPEPDIRKAAWYLDRAMQPIERYLKVTNKHRKLYDDTKYTIADINNYIIDFTREFQSDIENIIKDIFFWATDENDVAAYSYLIDARRHMNSIIELNF